MIVAIHQPHYFPWLGYFDKIINSDKFVILDQVQFEKGSQMIRNRLLDANGNIKYITISADTNNYLQKEYNDIFTKHNAEWKLRQLNAIKNYYRKAEYYSETYSLIEDFLTNDYQRLSEWTIESIYFICGLLKIDTPLIKQSEITYDRTQKKSDLVFAICKSLDANIYLSGRGGSMRYLKKENFAQNDIKIQFQEFAHPIYNQVSTNEFVSGLSILDALFNCGIDGVKHMLMKN